MLLGCIMIRAGTAVFAAEPEAAAGKRLYQEGIGSAGHEVSATVEGDVTVTGPKVACVSCHRRSGFGSFEGGRGVPPVNAAALFESRDPRLPGANSSDVRRPGARPAYADATLARAIREGVDPAGRNLNPMMPRFTLSDGEMQALIAYLRTLSAQSAPGVTDDTIHFATVIADGVDPRAREALIDVIEAQFRDHNAESRQDVRRGARAVLGHSRSYRAYRKWQLHVWELNGPAESWDAQLVSLYRSHAVYAVVSGAGSGNWHPVHEFCERMEIPCLFPTLNVPVEDPTSFYSVYLSRGVLLEAEVLAQRLRSSGNCGNAREIVQVYRDSGAGRAAAARLTEQMSSVAPAVLRDKPLRQSETLSPEFWKQLFDKADDTAFVLWLERGDLETLRAGSRPAAIPPTIVLSSSLAGDRLPAWPSSLPGRVCLVHPFDLPGNWNARRAPFSQWLQQRGIQLTAERVQANARLAVTALVRAMKHQKENFSREYLLEWIEHMADNSAWTSVYPRLSLGPGQRFASKGAYVLSLSDRGEWSAVSEWIVPR
jgi:mono/diheme cytochrome c family protein